MAHERIKPEFLFDEEKIQKLIQIAPECFEDGKINFETLRQNLGDWAQDEEDGDVEHFGLSWPGKKDARRLATLPPEGTLEPVYGEGLKVDGTPDDDGVNDSKNIFIEGENLEVLKILQKSYANRIKVIYIDPPYNTGNDFVYDDDFTEPLQEYLRRTGQIDEEGKPLTTNKKSDGRFHSKWLSMMYPRLRLARNLLKEDGVIFVSIDDNEVHNLRAIMNEIFGEENFLGNIVRATGQTTGQDSGGLGSSFDFILVYAKNADTDLSGLPLTPKDLKRFDNVDEKGNYAYDQLRKTGSSDRREDRPKMWYPIIDPDGGEVYPIAPAGYEGRWRVEPKTFTKLIEDDLIFWKKSKRTDGEIWWPYVKYYAEGRTKRPSPLWNDLDGNKKAARDLRDLFDGKKLFDFPKPLALLKRLILIAPNVNEDDIVLDFFAGSASTAHAVLEVNKEQNYNLKFICVQIPQQINLKEESYKVGYKTLSQLSVARIKKAIKKLNIRSGVSVKKLTASSYRKWNDIQGNNISHLENAIDLFNSSPLREDWNKNKLITELTLLEGFPLDSIQSKLMLSSNEIVKIESEMVPNKLLICLDDVIDEGLIEELNLDSTSIFICLDSAISNQNKLRLSDKGLIKTI